MKEKSDALIIRTRAFAKSVIQLCQRATDSDACNTQTEQLIDAATSVAANYRAACRARSKKEFIAKMGLVVEEVDESYGWLTLLVETSCLQQQEAGAVIQEADELTRIFVASYRTAQRNYKIAQLQKRR